MYYTVQKNWHSLNPLFPDFSISLQHKTSSCIRLINFDAKTAERSLQKSAGNNKPLDYDYFL